MTAAPPAPEALGHADRWRIELYHAARASLASDAVRKWLPGADRTKLAESITADLRSAIASGKPRYQPPPEFSAAQIDEALALVAEAALDEVVPAAGADGEADSASRKFRYEYPVLDSAALYGLAGEFVRLVEPETEADPVALLIQFLVAAGNAIGRSAYFEVEATGHYCNLFAVAVGPTASGRKGTSWAHVRAAMLHCDNWFSACVKTGLSSGEGIIHAVRGPITKREALREKGRFTGEYQEVESDPGVADKRLLIYAPEFSQPLKVANREANILSDVLRAAWETGDLRTLNKSSPEQATGAHISIVAHISKSELLSLLSENDCLNGYANRFLWYCCRRSKELPLGGAVNPTAMGELQDAVAAAVARARGLGRAWFSPASLEIWRRVYPELSRPRPGLLGSVVSRAEAQTLRLAVLYAALAGQSEISPDHLSAALAVWQYCEDSAAYIFGDRLGNPVASKIFDVLRAGREMSRAEISDLLGRNLPAARISAALAELEREGLIVAESRPTGGRTAQVWRATGRETPGTKKAGTNTKKDPERRAAGELSSFNS